MSELGRWIAAFRRFARVGLWAYFALAGVVMLTVSLIAGDPEIAVLSAALLVLVVLRLARFYRDGPDD
jgi:hypothetical protein